MPILTAPVPRGSSSNPRPSFQRIRLSRPHPASPATPPARLTQPAEEGDSAGETPLLPPQTTPQPVTRQSFRRVRPSSASTRRVRPKPPPTAAPARPEFEPSGVTLPPGELRARGPINAADDDLWHKHNAVDNEEEGDSRDPHYFGTRFPSGEAPADNGVLMIGSLSRAPDPSRTPVRPAVPTPTIPLTFLTTYTYLTTVQRGPHTALLSRLSVDSATVVQPIDRHIVTAIEENGGVLLSASASPLGSKTKGQTTTVYNVASEIRVFNEDLYKVIFATRTEQPLPPVSSQWEPSQPSDPPTPPPEPVRVPLHSLETEAKWQVAQYTYFYTLVDSLRTRYSTRTEATTLPFTGQLASLAPSLATSIGPDGDLAILSPTSTVPLGSRAQGHLTTVVNLALNHHIHFDHVRHALLTPDIEPSRPVEEPVLTQWVSPTASHSLASSLHSTEGQSAPPPSHSPTLATPHLSQTPNAPSPSPTPLPTPTTRVRTHSTRRPAVRVRVKPVRSKLSHLSRLSSPSPPQSSAVSPPPESSQSVSPSPEATPTLPPPASTDSPLSARKKVAFTVRKPGHSPVNRFLSRRPSVSHRARVTPELSPTPSPEATATRTETPSSSQVTATPPLESPSLSASSRASKHRYRVFTRIGGAVNNWNPLYASRVRVSSRKVLKSTSPPDQPVSLETAYETTTHTVPFTIGSSTIYTTVEETNSRVVTHSPLSPSFQPPATPTDHTHTASTSESRLVATSSVTSSASSLLPRVEPVSASVLLETSQVESTSTLYSTLTYYATLFNGSQTSVTPLEEVKTEYVTLRAPVTLTRTVLPSTAAHSTVTHSTQSTDSNDLMQLIGSSLVTETFSTHTTLTHFITLFSGSHTILSSIEEISPTVLVLTRPISQPTSSLPAPVSRTTLPVSSTSSLVGQSISPATPTDTSPVNSTVESGSVIELKELLEGVHDAGQIGETIKDIVKDIVTNKQADRESPDTPTTTPLPTTTLAPSLGPDRPTSRGRHPVFVASAKPAKQQPGSDQSTQPVIFSTQSDQPQSSLSTKYVTSVDKSIRTLTLTSTKVSDTASECPTKPAQVYYTRDSPLTITSLLTTTIPAVTYVSTIIGSKTILGTYNSITPTRTETPPPASSVVTGQPTTTTATPTTTRPRLHRPKASDPPLVKAKVTPFLTSRKAPNSTTPPSPPPLARNESQEVCSPACNATKREYCRQWKGQYGCECRPGFVRRPSDGLCQGESPGLSLSPNPPAEIKNYLVSVRVSKTAESEVAATSSSEGELQNYAKVARRQVGQSIAGLQVLSVDRSALRSKGALVNLTIQIEQKGPNVQDELARKLQPLGQVERVVDFDECSSPLHHDCSPRARCLNEPGSYRCQCLEAYIDLDPSLPGRLCVSEVKSCDFCHGRGDCWRNQSDTVCRCHPMYIGRRCEINGLRKCLPARPTSPCFPVLAILVPIVAILLIVAIVSFLYCSRRLRHRNRRFKNLAAYGPVAVIGGTLDRKAMLETSSESSDPQHRSHYTVSRVHCPPTHTCARRTSRTQPAPEAPWPGEAPLAGRANPVWTAVWPPTRPLAPTTTPSPRRS